MRKKETTLTKISKYLKSLINADTKESSKRFIALFTMLLSTYVVVAFTNKSNAVQVLGELLLFVLVLLGLAVWQSRKSVDNKE